MKKERILWIIAMTAVVTWSVMGRKSDQYEVSSVTETKARRHSRESTSSGGDTSLRERLSHSSATTTNLEGRSMRVLQLEDPLSRLAAFLRILDSADVKDMALITSALQQLRSAGGARPMEEELLNLRAGQLNGAQLLAERRGSAEDFSMIGDLKKQYEGWIQSEPQAAKGWLDSLPSGKYRDQMAVTYIASRAKDDPAGSLNLVSSLHPSQQATAGKAAAEQMAASSGIDGFSQILDGLDSSSPNGADAYLSAMLDSMLSISGSAGDILIEKHLNQPYVTGSVLTRISANKAKSDPVGALQWATAMEGQKSDLSQGEVVASAIGGMDLSGLESAKNWAQTQNDGAPYWLAVIEKREEYLKDRRGEENIYDKDD